MGQLVDDVLTFCRMGRVELQKTTIHLHQLIPTVIGELEGEMAGRVIDWKIHPLPQVQGDAALLHQVFLNLIGNAIKYTRPRTPATIEIGSDTSHAMEHVVFVRDNGVGFDMQYVSKLFGVFQRLHTASEFEGTGVGLANVRRIISRHGGRTWAEGAVNQGATVYVSFPTAM
jgi:light-regulated signal transduction histidine kinase (bacteriophytochrome)